MRKQSGYTLLELLVVVGCIFVLTAFALPMYQGYVDQAQLGRVKAHHHEAAQFVEAEMRAVQATVASGGGSLADADTRYASWLAVLDDSTIYAPLGAESTYQVGVGQSGSFAAGDLAVTFESTVGTTTVSFASM